MKSLQKIAFSAIFLIMFSLLLVIIFGDNGLLELSRLHGTHQKVVNLNADLTKENMQLYRNIDRLQTDPAYVESVARRELGMIRSNEMIFSFKDKSVKKTGNDN